MGRICDGLWISFRGEKRQRYIGEGFNIYAPVKTMYVDCVLECFGVVKDNYTSMVGLCLTIFVLCSPDQD